MVMIMMLIFAPLLPGVVPEIVWEIMMMMMTPSCDSLTPVLCVEEVSSGCAKLLTFSPQPINIGHYG